MFRYVFLDVPTGKYLDNFHNDTEQLTSFIKDASNDDFLISQEHRSNAMNFSNAKDSNGILRCFVYA